MKKILSAALAVMMILSMTYGVKAATREEIAAIQVSKAGKFNYWTKESTVKQALVDYVKDVTNKGSKNFIPIEDRIAVFDLDGTLVCETAPYYFEWMMYLDRALYDNSYTPSKIDKDYAKAVEGGIRKTGKFPSNVDKGEAISQESVFAGMTEAEYKKFVESFMNKPVEGLSNLKWGESFYLPMVEVVKYLQANDFTIYIVSGSDRQLLRILACDVLKIKPNHVIGTDAEFLASHQGNKDGLEYVWRKDDELIRGQFLVKNIKMNKVSVIAQEIGKKPVLAFGNSSGDASMFNYTVNGNKYKSLAFALLCDDTERELGNISKAEKMKKDSEKNGWIAVSMKNDFKTIYGDNVERLK